MTVGSLSQVEVLSYTISIPLTPPQVEYFRGKDLVEFLKTNDQLLKRNIQPILDEQLDGRCPADDEDCAKLVKQLIVKGKFLISYLNQVKVKIMLTESRYSLQIVRTRFDYTVT